MTNLYTLQQCSARIGNDPDGAVVGNGSIQFSDGEGDNWGGSFDCGRHLTPFVADQQYSIWHGRKHVRALGVEDDSSSAVFAGIGARPLEKDYP